MFCANLTPPKPHPSMPPPTHPNQPQPTHTSATHAHAACTHDLTTPSHDTVKPLGLGHPTSYHATENQKPQPHARAPHPTNHPHCPHVLHTSTSTTYHVRSRETLTFSQKTNNLAPKNLYV